MRVDALGNVVKAMYSLPRVHVHRRIADEFRQAPARHSTREVHLEKAILRVDKSGCEGNVSARTPGDRHGAQRVALDHGLALETRHRPLAVDDGQAAAHGQESDCHAQEQERGQAEQYAGDDFHGGEKGFGKKGGSGGREEVGEGRKRRAKHRFSD